MKRRGKIAIFGAATVALAAVSGAIAFGSSGTSLTAAPVPAARTLNAPAGPKWPGAAERGVDTTRAVVALRLRSGAPVRVVEGNGWRCMLYDGVADSCQRPALIAQGLSLDIVNDCSVPRGSMAITGLVPDGVTDVAINYSDGSTRRASTTAGMFAYETTTPTAGDPVPTAVTWSDPSGAKPTAHPFPIGSGDFCPGG